MRYIFTSSDAQRRHLGGSRTVLDIQITYRTGNQTVSGSTSRRKFCSVIEANCHALTCQALVKISQSEDDEESIPVGFVPPACPPGVRVRVLGIYGTNACGDITFSQLRWRAVEILHNLFCVVPQEGAGVTSSTDGEGDDEMSSSGTGFFISFDNKTPKPKKPKLKSREKKVKYNPLWEYFSHLV